MNVLCVRDGKLVTPPLSDTILPGITRRSVLQLARDRDIEVVEERIAVDGDWSRIQEVLTCGTAVGVQGVRELSHAGQPLFEGEAMGPITRELASALNAVRFGTTEDHPEWRLNIDR